MCYVFLQSNVVNELISKIKQNNAFVDEQVCVSCLCAWLICGMIVDCSLFFVFTLDFVLRCI